MQMFADPWITCWSNGHRRAYVFNSKTGQQGWQHEIANAKLCETFW
jgi:hypothetical protein